MCSEVPMEANSKCGNSIKNIATGSIINLNLQYKI